MHLSRKNETKIVKITHSAIERGNIDFFFHVGRTTVQCVFLSNDGSSRTRKTYLGLESNKAYFSSFFAKFLCSFMMIFQSGSCHCQKGVDAKF